MLFDLINSSPFVRHVGMTIDGLEWGSARFQMEAGAFRLQPLGVVHAGNIATLIDSATFWACFLAMDSDDDGLTSVDLKLNYLAPARVEPLTCVGTLIKAGKRLSYAEADVVNARGDLLAHGTSTLMGMRASEVTDRLVRDIDDDGRRGHRLRESELERERLASADGQGTRHARGRLRGLRADHRFNRVSRYAEWPFLVLDAVGRGRVRRLDGLRFRWQRLQ